MKNKFCYLPDPEVHNVLNKNVKAHAIPALGVVSAQCNHRIKLDLSTEAEVVETSPYSLCARCFPEEAKR